MLKILRSANRCAELAPGHPPQSQGSALPWQACPGRSQELPGPVGEDQPCPWSPVVPGAASLCVTLPLTPESVSAFPTGTLDLLRFPPHPQGHTSLSFSPGATLEGTEGFGPVGTWCRLVLQL